MHHKCGYSLTDETQSLISELMLCLICCQDDGELYDEFGNLKKKFRAKTQAAEAGRAPGAGRAGWEVEELGILSLPLVFFSCTYL